MQILWNWSILLEIHAVNPVVVFGSCSTGECWLGWNPYPVKARGFHSSSDPSGVGMKLLKFGAWVFPLTREGGDWHGFSLCLAHGFSWGQENKGSVCDESLGRNWASIWAPRFSFFLGRQMKGCSERLALFGRSLLCFWEGLFHLSLLSLPANLT